MSYRKKMHLVGIVLPNNSYKSPFNYAAPYLQSLRSLSLRCDSDAYKLSGAAHCHALCTGDRSPSSSVSGVILEVIVSLSSRLLCGFGLSDISTKSQNIPLSPMWFRCLKASRSRALSCLVHRRPLPILVSLECYTRSHCLLVQSAPMWVWVVKHIYTTKNNKKKSMKYSNIYNNKIKLYFYIIYLNKNLFCVGYITIFYIYGCYFN